MAKSKKEVKEKPIEVNLWEAASKLRGSVELQNINMWYWRLYF